MATTHTTTIKRYNGTDWDTIHFETDSGAIIHNDGTLNETLSFLDERLNNLEAQEGPPAPGRWWFERLN